MNEEYIAQALILSVAMYLFWSGRLRTDITALLVMLGLIFPWPHHDGLWRGILTYQEGFSGFGSAAVVMVVAMFILGGAIVRTGLVDFLGGRLFRACAQHELRLQMAVLGLATTVSMFVNDTTVVLVLLPTIMALCKENDLSPSRYLLCLAYGSLLGGQWTLIGTRSNIIISDYLLHRSGTGLGFFSFTPIAAVVFAACAAYFILIGRRYLPKVDARVMLEESLATRYLTEVTVTAQSHAVGKTLETWAWGRRADVSVLEVIRGPERIPPYGGLRLQRDDVLVLAGPASTTREFLKTPDFELKQEVQIGKDTLRSADLVTVEALLTPNSAYAGATLEEVDFGPEFGFTVMGIARHGNIIEERPTATPMRYGDALLLLGHVSGIRGLKHNPNLILLEQQVFPVLGKRRALLVLAILVGMVGTAVSGVLSPAISIPLAAMLAILFRCIQVQELYHSVDWQSVVTVAGMIPFGLALEKTGAAAAVGQSIGHVMPAYGPLGMLGALLLLAVALTQLIENAAVAIILAPVAYQASVTAGMDPKPFLVGLAICVSSAFCTPVAHESTILVMGPGGYQFKHYFQIGGAMALLTWLLGTLITPLVWPFR